MQVSIIAFGTRGDVQPLLALGRALRQRGHLVRLIASRHFAGWIEGHGLEAVPASVDIQQVMKSEGGVEWAEKGTNPLQQTRLMRRLFARHGLAMMNDAWEACRGADVIISGFTSDVYATSIAEKLGSYHVSAPLQPILFPTRSGPASTQAPLPERESWINRLFGWLLLEPFPWQMAGKLTNRFRRETLDLPPQTGRQNRECRRRMLVIHGYSPRVVPHPPDWPANFHTAGYWFLDETAGWEPPADLSDFLAAGEPPVYIGFGSMTGRDPARLTGLLLEAVRRSGCRAILQTGWMGVGAGELPAGVFRLAGAPHSWLFPRMRAVVHHGGAGTTAEGLQAGVPTIIVPHMADQPFWGRRVAALGAGPRPIPRPQLTAANLAAAIRAAEDAGIRARAAALGGQIAREDGIGRALMLLEAAWNA